MGEETVKTRTRKLAIRNAMAELRRMGDRELGQDREMSVRLKVCALEAVSNVIRYAYSDRDTHMIGLRLAVGDGRVTLEIEDDGREFNPLALPDRAPLPNVEKAQLAGIGIRIIRGLLPESRYEWRDGKNVLILTGTASAPSPGN